MPIPVVSFLETSPTTNPNYGVVADEYLIGGWRSVADISARDAIYSGRRVVGQFVYVRDVDQVYRLDADLVTWHLAGAGSVTADITSIYVDPAGDDSASGASGDPIQTIEELARRIPAKGLVRVWLAAGTYELSAYDGAAATYENRTILSGEKVYIRGAVNILETFNTSGAVSGNVVTAAGSPGWTIDEHAGKWIRWFIWGAGWPDFGYGWQILSNTADTLTVAASWASPGLGGFVPAPTNGTELEIVEKTSKIIRPASSDVFTNKLYYDGRVVFQDVVFDGSGAASRWGATGWTPHAAGEFYWCEFLDQTAVAIDAVGSLLSYGCYFRDSGIAIIVGAASGTVNGDNYFDGCTVGIQGSVAFAHGDHGWAKDCALVFEGGVADGALSWWLDNCEDFCRLDGGGRYSKSGAALNGFDATKRTLNGRVFYLIDPYAKVSLFDATLIDVGPGADFVVTPTVTLSLTNYIAGGQSALLPGGRRVDG